MPKNLNADDDRRTYPSNPLTLSQPHKKVKEKCFQQGTLIKITGSVVKDGAECVVVPKNILQKNDEQFRRNPLIPTPGRQQCR